MAKKVMALSLGLILVTTIAIAQPAHYLEELFPVKKSMVDGEKPYTFFEKPFQLLAGTYVQYLFSNRVNEILSKELGASGKAAKVKLGAKLLQGDSLPQLGPGPNAKNLSARAINLIVQVKGKGPGKLAGYAWVEDTLGERIGALIVSGPCADLGPGVPMDSYIRLCCPSPEGSLVWKTVPLELEAGKPHDLGDGFVTGRAGFFKEKGVRMFYVEYLAWPEDPVQIGG